MPRIRKFTSTNEEKALLLIGVRNTIQRLINELVDFAMQDSITDIIGDDYFNHLKGARDDINNEIGALINA